MGIFGRRKPKPKPFERTGHIIDMTRTAWGHNFSIISHDEDSCKVWVWVSPGPRVGDQLKWKTAYGTAVFDIMSVEWVGNVDDMYKLEMKIAGRIHE